MPSNKPVWRENAEKNVIAPLAEWDALQEAEARAKKAEEKREALKQYAIKGAKLLLKVMEKDPELAGVAKMLGFMLPGAPKDISNTEVVAQLSDRLDEQTTALISQMERIAEKQAIIAEIAEGRRHANKVKTVVGNLKAYHKDPSNDEALKDLRDPAHHQSCGEAVTWARGALVGEWASVNVPKRIMDASYGDLRLTGRFTDTAVILLVTAIIADTAVRTFHEDYAETPWSHKAMKRHVSAKFGDDLKAARRAYHSIDQQLRSEASITAWSTGWLGFTKALQGVPGCSAAHRTTSAQQLYHQLEEKYPQRDWSVMIFGYCNGANNQSWFDRANSHAFKRFDAWADAKADNGGTCIVSHWPIGAPGAKTIDGLPAFAQQVADNSAEIDWKGGKSHADGLSDMARTLRAKYPGYFVLALRNKTSGGKEPVPIKRSNRKGLGLVRSGVGFTVAVMGAVE